ncbi:MAG: tetratricopeptide repeat protein [Nitrospinota bacterium]|nr:tetratricopeptide repeat protein [Nitrospinota bacterium]MDH5678048.1 tetratricopeptide repeat protein [Nitrospinota bacterium]MDH5757378.1 tetratricopeptide repeat protein [Nitrospinota bacterium]
MIRIFLVLAGLAMTASLGACSTFEKPDNPLKIVAQADMAYSMGDYRSAEALYARLVEIKGAPYESYFRLGNIYARTKRVEKAVEMYKQALKKKHDFSPAWRNLGVAYMRQSMVALQESQKNLSKDDPLYISNMRLIDGLAAIELHGSQDQ